MFDTVIAQIDPPAPIRPDLRSEWMLKEGIIFLNHGSFGAMPRSVFAFADEQRRQIEAEPIELIGRRGEALIESAKASVGRRFGMKSANFGFVTNATEGVNAVLRSLAIQPGDELLTTNHVYHAVRQTMKLTARQRGATCREIDIPLPVRSADEIRDRVLDAISPSTRLLLIDHVTSPSALVFPIKDIVAGCRAKGVDVLIDGAHAPGMLDLDVEQIGATYYTANLHKWVCAPKGTAFLWVTPERQTQVHPAVVSHNLDSGFDREFCWQGTRDLSAWLTAPAAIAFLEDLGWERVLKHNHQLATWAQQMLSKRFGTEALSPMDGSLLGSMATVMLPGRLSEVDGDDAVAMQQRFYLEYQCELPVVRWAGKTYIRVSCQVYNTAADYETLAKIVLGMVKQAS